ncbi:MAG: hypothetical protein KDD25_06525 [Bdellovibrionales bacterium]|nr:hypothetical protein [Bdellovibrionales bacterium]
MIRQLVSFVRFLKCRPKALGLIASTLLIAGCQGGSGNGGHGKKLKVVGLELRNPASEGPIIIENKEDRDFIGDPFEEEDEQTHPQALISWTPTGVRERETSSKCRRDKIEQLLNAESVGEGESISFLQEFFDECEDDLTMFSGSGWFDQLKMSFIDYKLADNPRIHEAKFTFSNGEVLRGHLGIKPSDVPRPLIIARCGVFCNVGSATGRMMMMHLFDESPFHVLWLGSTTGSDFIDANGYVSIGGYYEAVQQMKILDYLRSADSPLFGKISSVHLFGLSLGANTALVSTLLSQENGRPFASSIATCPVVNLDLTLKEVFKNNIRGWYMRSKTWNAVSSSVKKGGIPAQVKPEMEGFPELVRNIASFIYSKSAALPGNRYRPFDDWDFKDPDQINKVNQFSRYIDQVDIPMMIWGSDDDPVVPQRVNSEPLRQIGLENDDVGVLFVPQGKHCAFSSIYGWDTTSSIFRNFYLSNSPEFSAFKSVQKRDISNNDISNKPKLNEYYYSAEWKLSKNKEYFDVSYQIWSPSQEPLGRCRNPVSAPATCFRYTTSKISFEDLSINPLYVYKAKTKSEAEAITRWANTNLKITDSDGKDIAFTMHNPSSVEWVDYE